MKTLSLNQVIEASLTRSYSYQAYRKLIDDLLQEGRSTAPEQDENLTEYSKMNQRRMKRWDKTLKISEDAKAEIKAYDEKLIWLVISEGWCGDAAHSLPVMNKMAELNPNIEMRVVLRDQHEVLMNQFLTNDGKSIPKLIMYNPGTQEVIGSWGPRPTPATQLVEAYKLEHGKLDAELKEQLQLWYNKDKGRSIVEELSNLIY